MLFAIAPDLMVNKWTNKDHDKCGKKCTKNVNKTILGGAAKR